MRSKPGAVASNKHLHIVYRIDALLHTMRAVERHEEQLCSIMHAIKTSGAVDPAIHQDLDHLLEDLPSDALHADLEAVRQALSASAGSRPEAAATETSPSRPRGPKSSIRPKPTGKSARKSS